ncbi:MAG: diversity-generating retroelement protein Avd [Candidatus Omnitrophica bacterium COP1]|nr:diversity-generating retroelement protein Avd [bacterium]MCE7907649.1 diversity-generating retroelement protein Avd [Candidatus Omnitrophica bacterium COP1]
MRDNPQVIQKIYDLIVWYAGRIEKFPAGKRIILGDRILTGLLDTLDLLLEAYYTREKQPRLQRANLNLERLRYLSRLALDLKCVSISQFEFSARSIDEIGQQVGGWLKQAR